MDDRRGQLSALTIACGRQPSHRLSYRYAETKNKIRWSCIPGTHKIAPTGRLHVLRTPKYSSFRIQPSNQTEDSQSLTPPKTKFPKSNRAPKINVPFPERILQSPQVKALLPKVMYQLDIELSYHNEHCPKTPIGIPPDEWYHKYYSRRTINYHSRHTYVRTYNCVWIISVLRMKEQMIHKMYRQKTTQTFHHPVVRKAAFRLLRLSYNPNNMKGSNTKF